MDITKPPSLVQETMRATQNKTDIIWRYDDAQTYDLANIEFLNDFYIYIHHMNFWKITVFKGH